jgi:hypothetical protein
LKDEMGDELFKSYMNSHLMKTSYPVLLNSFGSKWWDNLSTREIENRNTIVSQQARMATRHCCRKATIYFSGNLPGGVKRAERINSRQEQLKRICIALKDVAVDTGLPLCLTAQFNREVYNLLDIHPTKIREAADIEQIVNTLVGLWNLGKKDVAKETTGGNLNEIKLRTGGAESGMYVELLKSRDLSTGIYEVLEFNGNTGKVKNSSTDYSFFDNSK